MALGPALSTTPAHLSAAPRAPSPVHLGGRRKEEDVITYISNVKWDVPSTRGSKEESVVVYRHTRHTQANRHKSIGDSLYMGRATQSVKPVIEMDAA